MNKRVAKKIAKKFMRNRNFLPYGFRTEEWQAYNDGTPPIIKYLAVFPAKVEKEIWEIAFQQGWDGCHWDDPLLLKYDDEQQRRYEEKYNPPHCW